MGAYFHPFVSSRIRSSVIPHFGQKSPFRAFFFYSSTIARLFVCPSVHLFVQPCSLPFWCLPIAPFARHSTNLTSSSSFVQLLYKLFDYPFIGQSVYRSTCLLIHFQCIFSADSAIFPFDWKSLYPFSPSLIGLFISYPTSDVQFLFLPSLFM